AFSSANTAATSSAFLSAISGLVLYLITVRRMGFSSLAAAKAALRSQGRLEPAKGCGPEKIFLGPLRYAFAIDRLANAPWIGGANGYIIRCVETSQTGAASDDDNAATAASCRHRRRRFRRAGSGLWPRRRAGQDHADRPPQPSSVPAAALPGRNRIAGHLGNRLADPLSAARSQGGDDAVRQCQRRR